MAGSPAVEIDWERLDKRKFFTVGVGMFTGITTGLYPLTVIKTRQMALDHTPRGLKGAWHTARLVVHHDGVRGLYRGFGTVVCGMIPARIVYLNSLEASKAGVSTLLQRQPRMSDAAVAGAASFVAGGMASLSSQLITVPVDVISQRQMITGGGQPRPGAAVHAAPGASAAPGFSAPSSGPSSAATSSAPTAGSGALGQTPQQQQQRRPGVNGLHLARQIVRQEGVRGLYRGLGASIATFVPGSATWWGSYGLWQKLLWQALDPGASPEHSARSSGEALGVQTASGVLAGCTTAFATNPLDVVKTRLQTAGSSPGATGAAPAAAATPGSSGSASAGAAPRQQQALAAVRHSWLAVARQLAREEGIAGFYRGVAPRMVNSSIWGTTMVTAYEFLKRICQLPPAPAGT